MSADNWTDCPRCAVQREFREDWEVGVFGGEFFVQYTGVCKACDFRYEFKYEQAIKVDES
jgi:hypothetical protein